MVVFCNILVKYYVTTPTKDIKVVCWNDISYLVAQTLILNKTDNKNCTMPSFSEKLYTMWIDLTAKHVYLY